LAEWLCAFLCSKKRYENKIQKKRREREKERKREKKLREDKFEKCSEFEKVTFFGNFLSHLFCSLFFSPLLRE
jgi:hypothetical protein